MIKSPPRYARHSRFFAGIVTTSAALLTLNGCNNVSPSVNNQTIKQPITAVTPAVQAVVGDYASEGYAKRVQGSDWVGVMIRADGADNGEQIDINVRARSDVKKPTCHFDGKATLMGQDDAHGVIFQSKVNDSTAFFQFKDGTLSIDSKDKYTLNYFCSGGGSIVGEYQKLQGDLELH
ncbi:hypothetical protein FHS24_000383 [Psychrobacter luti]|uniref:Uncharacterized protein n=1 Tax=Psychrobacter luti TaxID=198481 RepID=A0A839T8U2_9GAMM|nr:hypothetical protein [Psychrobacter luti]MBB3105892.1 hypothetical protein [Psychrobacter luti]